VEVDWTYYGFDTTEVNINAGDEVDIVNTDYSHYLHVTGASPEYFDANFPPGYYLPYVYHNPGSFTFADQFGDTVRVGVYSTTPLSVAITTPANNAVFSAPASFTVTAAPSGGTPPYAWMDFYLGNQMCDSYNYSFTTTITNLAVGTYKISAVAYDNMLNTATNSIFVNVVAPTPPKLTATLVGNQFIISWPANNSSGFSLKGSAKLGLGASWSAVGATPVLVGNQRFVTNPISGTAQFFRLSSP
jgi:plastocyanin